MLVLIAAAYSQSESLTSAAATGLALSAIPADFTSFGFHGSVPSIVSYMDGNIP